MTDFQSQDFFDCVGCVVASISQLSPLKNKFESLTENEGWPRRPFEVSGFSSGVSAVFLFDDFSMVFVGLAGPRMCVQLSLLLRVGRLSCEVVADAVDEEQEKEEEFMDEEDSLRMLP